MSEQKVGDFSEDELIARLVQPIAEPLDDDVAALDLPAQNHLLVSTDALQEGIHFLRESPAWLVGQKTVRVNVSDIVASGGRPLWLSLSMSLPKELELSWLVAFLGGVQKALAHTGVTLIGGDTTASLGPISLSATILGLVKQGDRLKRSGGKAGDIVAVTGALGEAGLGLEVILNQRDFGKEQNEYWQERHFCPPFRGEFGLALAKRGLASAMMDLSDGLVVDLPRLCKASGQGALIELAHLPLSEAGRNAGVEPPTAAVSGEDYELLCCIPPWNWPEALSMAELYDTPFTKIGSLRAEPQVSWNWQGQPFKGSFNSWRHFD